MVSCKVWNYNVLITQNNKVSVLGELSDISKTYSIDKLSYSKAQDASTDVATLTIMHSKDSGDQSFYSPSFNQTVSDQRETERSATSTTYAQLLDAQAHISLLNAKIAQLTAFIANR